MVESGPVIVFDGVCVLCNRWVDFILRHDHAGRFRLAAMQGTSGRALLMAHGLSPDDPTSLLLIQQGNGYTDTDAIARVLREFGAGWRWLGRAIKLVPRFVRDPLYRWFARHRYRLFGKRAVCRLPDSTEAWRFLD